MKILVTGSKGFIGSNFIRHLFKHDVDGYDIIDGYVRPKALNINQYDWILHIGAVSSTTELNIQKVIDLNVSWSIELFEECVKYNKNFQWASSASVYGLRLQNNGPMCVGDVCKPVNLYAQSKYLLEKYISVREVDIITQGFRYFNVYGPNEDHKGIQASPFFQFEKQARETGIIKVFEGSENFFRDFIHVDDLIKQQIEVMKHSKSGIYNIGTGSARSFMCIAKDIAIRYNAKIEKIPMPESLKQHYQKYTCAG
jgi:ADP-L-glycero-D-manno-heptose 6-epimerase